MTIAISLKVNDGVVLATDSASTLTLKTGEAEQDVEHVVYNNANKVFNLRKRLPIGVMTWGLGSIGNSSIERLVKDFRAKVSASDDDLHIDPQNYKLEDVAKDFKAFIYDDHYLEAYKGPDAKPDMGFILAGYSSSSNMAEEWRIQINPEGKCEGPALVRPPETCGMSWSGMPQAIQRLYFGIDPNIIPLLKDGGMDQTDAEKFFNQAREVLKAPIVWDPMPIQDAIDLARFLTKVTIDFQRFLPGPNRVGGPVEIATITKHEKFKWIDRKHFFRTELNPKEDPNAPEVD